MDRKKKRTPRLRPSKRLTVLKQWTMMKIQKPSLKRFWQLAEVLEHHLAKFAIEFFLFYVNHSCHLKTTTSNNF